MSSHVPRSFPGAQVNAITFTSTRELIAHHVWAPSSHDRINNIMHKLECLGVFPMSTIDLFEFALFHVIIKGGRNGDVACKSMIDSFKQAIKKWHFIHKAEHHMIDLEHQTVKMFMSGVSKMHQSVPKNRFIDPTAAHGHKHMAKNVWLSTVLWLYHNIFTSKISPVLATFRDLLILLFLWVDCRRQGDVMKITRDSLTDRGPPYGFTLITKFAKTTQTTEVISPIPEFTSDGIPFGNLLRLYLWKVGPKDGFLFRQTINGGRCWAPATKICKSSKKLIWTGFRSGAWNKDLQRHIKAANSTLPANEVKTLTAHSCRGGAALSALNEGIDRHLVSQMLSHKSSESINNYTRLSERQLNSLHAKI